MSVSTSTGGPDMGLAVRSHVADGVRWIVFDRPEKLNALTSADVEEIARLAGRPGPQTSALAFTGTGSRSFCAGVHTATFVDLDPAGARAFIANLRDCLAAVRTSPLPTAAMINGYCLGAGFELALACDVRVSTQDSQFGLPEVKVGIPSVIDAALLPGHVGLAMAKEIILTGDLYPAAEMYRLGLLNRVVARERLREETDELLARITRHTSVVLASQKRLFEIWQNRALTDAIDDSVDEFAAVFASPETLEQIRRYRASTGSTAAPSEPPEPRRDEHIVDTPGARLPGPTPGPVVGLRPENGREPTVPPSPAVRR